jgi:hypothetical protein
MQETAAFIRDISKQCETSGIMSFRDALSVDYEEFTPVFSLFNERVKRKVAKPLTRRALLNVKRMPIPTQYD